MWVHLPAGGAVDMRDFAKDFLVALDGAPHFALGPFGVGLLDTVLPPDVVPAMDADLEFGVARAEQDVEAAPADVRPRQQCAVHQCLDAVMADHRGARYLAEEAGPKHALDGAASVIGAQ